MTLLLALFLLIPTHAHVVSEAFDVPTPGERAPRLFNVRVTRVNRDGDHLEVILTWRGRGAGTFAIEGPEGTLVATGVTLPNGRAWFRDVVDTQPISGLFARGIVFGEHDPVRLKENTLRWLNEVVAPAVDAHLGSTLRRP